MLLAQATRADGVVLSRGLVFTYALGVAGRIEELVGVGAMMLDPYDEETAVMWRDHGFQPVKDRPRGGQPPRLWLPLGA